MQTQQYRQYLYSLLLAVAFLFGSTACQDDPVVPGIDPDGIREGMVTFTISTSEVCGILTRANELPDDPKEKEPIEDVFLLLFDNGDDSATKGNLITFAHQQLIEGNNTVSLYMEAKKQTLYAVCNYPDTAGLLQKVTTLDGLKDLVVNIDRLDGAYTGSYIMEGMVEIDPGSTGTIKKSYTIDVKRLAAALNFVIRFAPEEQSEQFEISGVFMHNIPKGSYLLERGTVVNATDSLTPCTGDWMYDTATQAISAGRFFPDSMRLELTESDNGDYTASFIQFENRRGGVSDDNPKAWEKLNGLKGKKDEVTGVDLFEFYRQTHKKGLADGTIDGVTDFSAPYASYLTIHGVYKKGRVTYNVTYYMYLGHDNYKDFNVRRNHSYLYDIEIQGLSSYDMRVVRDDVGLLEVYGEYSEKIFDAHCNVSQVLMFASSGWTAYVENPDQTPWLELSNSATYRPRMPGDPAEGRAAFRLTGTGGLNYLYIHMDEYIPNQESPSNNSNEPRVGYIVCRCGTDAVKRIEVKQYPAQMVICHIDKNFHDGLHEVVDTFYVERVFEKKNMPWGFGLYWSFKTDSLIAIGQGQWDGLGNTRLLYDVAENGDKWGIKPAYPVEQYPEGIPSDVAVGYAIHKNRDRNGNGRIDYDEIRWYLPAANELQALSGHIYGKGNYYDETWNNTVKWDAESGNFHSSSPSSADPGGMTTGFSYYVSLADGKKHIGQRTRNCNVICVMRKSAGRGLANGEAGGKVENDETWGDEEEEIMDRD